MYWSAMTMRLLVGRLTPAIRATSVTPCGGPPTQPKHGSWGAAALRRFCCHLRRPQTQKANARLPLRLGCVAKSPTGYLRLINGFTAPSSTSRSEEHTSELQSRGHL